MALGALLNLSLFRGVAASTIEKFVQCLRHHNFDVNLYCHASDVFSFNSLSPIAYQNRFEEVITLDKVYLGYRIIFAPMKTDIRSLMQNPMDFQLFEVEFSSHSRALIVTSKQGRFTPDLNKPETFSAFLLHTIREYSFSAAVNLDSKTYLLRGAVVGNGAIPTLNFNRVDGDRAQSAPPTAPSTPKIRIKPLTNWTSTQHLISEWNRLLNPALPFEFSETNPDLYLVLNSANEITPPERTIYFMMEPYGEKLYKPYLDALSERMKPLFYGCHKHHLNCVEWHLRQSFSQLQTLPNFGQKSSESTLNNTLSVIVSDRQVDPGQKWRVGLVQHMDNLSKQGKLPFKLHIFGKCQSLNFANYKGELPRVSKDIGLMKYKYHFTAENNPIDNYITEKLYDSLLCGCLTFYRGCPNVRDYFNERVVVTLEEDYEACVERIAAAISQNEWEQNKTAIEAARTELLTKYSLSTRLMGIFFLSRALVVVRNEVSVTVEDAEYKKFLEDQSFHYILQASFDKLDAGWIQGFCTSLLMQLPPQQKQQPILILVDKERDNLLYQRMATTLVVNASYDAISSARNISEIHLHSLLLKPSALVKIEQNMLTGNPNVLQNVSICYN